MSIRIGCRAALHALWHLRQMCSADRWSQLTAIQDLYLNEGDLLSLFVQSQDCGPSIQYRNYLHQIFLEIHRRHFALPRKHPFECGFESRHQDNQLWQLNLLNIVQVVLDPFVVCNKTLQAKPTMRVDTNLLTQYCYMPEVSCGCMRHRPRHHPRHLQPISLFSFRTDSLVRYTLQFQ